MRPTSSYACIDLMHIFSPVTPEGFDGSHHPRCAECKIDVTQTLEFALLRVENCVGKGENASY